MKGLGKCCGAIPHRFQNFYNFHSLKKNSYFLLSKIAISLGLLEGRPSYRRCLQPLRREHSPLHIMKFLYFFLFLGLIFPGSSRPKSMDLDPHQTNPDQHQTEKSNPDPHQSAKTDPDPHQSEKSRIRILIKGKNRIRIRINVMRRATLFRTYKIEAPYL